ncbi:MAG TPA: hypothetical protein VJJ26_01975 [Candidatus Babeliales bacterium]|nr:hypothetical protein [Candidatus Babeliales bacterium]
MKNSKKLLLMAATMAVMANADVNNLTVKIGEHLTVEVFATGNNEDKNIFRAIARGCGDPDFEMAVQVSGKPFAVDKGEIEQDLEEAMIDNLNELLFSKDENGKTALDLVKEREKVTSCLDCTLLKQAYKGLMRDVLKAEHEKKVKSIEAEVDRNQ